MLFNSTEFLIFFTVVCLLYWILPHGFRWMLLLGASYYFYASVKVSYALLLLVSTVVGYTATVMMDRTDNDKKKWRWLLFSLIGNLGLLFIFKYVDFAIQNLFGFFAFFGLEFSPLVVRILLPVGISFYTFQSISYTLDVYHKRISAEKHFGIYSVYHSFFPQLVAGPIERGGHLLPQFYEKHQFDFERFTSGLRLSLWGFFKKVVIADRLALIVNQVFDNSAQFHGLPLFIATFFFVIQIYCDFSGYTDIARGTARMMGFELVINFNRPYWSKTISEFWRRWHISLSSWFQDYVFIPLYLRVSQWKRIKELPQNKRHFAAFFIAIIIVETMLGLWHGANWTFILFGLYHGLLIPGYYAVRVWWDRMPSVLQQLLTFSLVSFGMLIFRAPSLDALQHIVANLFTGFWSGIYNLYLGDIGELPGFLFCLALIFFLEVVEYGIANEKWSQWFNRKLPTGARWAAYMTLVNMILFFGINSKTTFIYFQF